MIVPIDDLTLQAVEAFVGIYLSERLDSLDHAFLGTELALTSALLSAPVPIEHAGARWDRERGPEHAQVATIEAPDEEAGCEKSSCK